VFIMFKMAVVYESIKRRMRVVDNYYDDILDRRRQRSKCAQ